MVSLGMDNIAIKNKMKRWNVTAQALADALDVTRATVERWKHVGSPAYRDDALKAALSACKTKPTKHRVYQPRDGKWKPRAGDMTEKQLEMLHEIYHAGSYELIYYGNVGAVPVMNALVRKELVKRYDTFYELTDAGESIVESGERDIQALSESFKVELELACVDPEMGQI